jgi:hypothetical protein
MNFEFPFKFEFSRLKIEWPKAVWSRISGFMRGLQFKVSGAPSWAKLSMVLSGLTLLALAIFLVIWLVI